MSGSQTSDPQIHEDEVKLAELWASIKESQFGQEIRQKVNSAKELAHEHPYILCLGLAVVAVGSIPVICFLLFVVGSAVIGLTGFILFEGAVVGVGLFLLSIVLFFLLIGGVFLFFGFGVSYFILAQSVNVMRRLMGHDVESVAYRQHSRQD